MFFIANSCPVSGTIEPKLFQGIVELYLSMDSAGTWRVALNELSKVVFTTDYYSIFYR